MAFSDAFDNANNAPTKPSSGLAFFDEVDAAPELKPVPPGSYAVRVVSGRVTETKKGDDAYKLCFEITEGEHTKHKLYRIYTMTQKAAQYAKRDLAFFGLTNSTQLLSPFPPTGKECFCRLTVALQRGDDGIERNDVKRIEDVRFAAAYGSDFLIDPNANDKGAK